MLGMVRTENGDSYGPPFFTPNGLEQSIQDMAGTTDGETVWADSTDIGMTRRWDSLLRLEHWRSFISGWNGSLPIYGMTPGFLCLYHL